MDDIESKNPFAPPIVSSEARERRTDLHRIARDQRLLIVALFVTLFSFAGGFIATTIPLAPLQQLAFVAIALTYVVGFVVRLIATWKLSGALRFNLATRILFVGLMMWSWTTIFGIIGVFLMLGINNSASHTLRANGIPIGFWGVSNKHRHLVETAQAKLDGAYPFAEAN